MIRIFTTYIGLTENAFKTRYRNHTASFRHTKHRNSTELSKHVWSLKDNNIDYSVSWRIMSSSPSDNSSSKRCNLCLKVRLRAQGSWGGGGTPYDCLYGEIPPERDIFSRPQVYERVGILLVEVYKRVGKSVAWVCERAQKG